MSGAGSIRTEDFPGALDRAGRTGSRAAAALRFGASVAVSAGATWLLCWLQPRQLSVVTDIVGHPIHANFNYQTYFWRYYLGVLFAPALAAGFYHLIGLRWPGSRWPASKAKPPQDEGETPAWVLVLSQASRALVVGAAFGLGFTLFDRQGATRFWRDLSAVTFAYAAILLAVAALVARRGSVHRFAQVSARLNALAAPFTVASLLAASLATQVIVASDGSVHAYPWLPWWIAALATALLFLATLNRCLRARELDALRRVEAHALLVVVLPIVLYLYTAALPWALGSFDSFHFGEFLAAARLFAAGAFPWRDSIFIHGLLQDVFTPLAGFKLFGDTAWGGWAGFGMLAGPFWWIAQFLLLAYLIRGNVALFLAAVAAPLLGSYAYLAHWRFAFLPLILLALAALLDRATWPRAFLLAFALIASNVLVPELAYAVPACGAALLGFELTRSSRDQGLFANLPRTVRATVAGVALAALWVAYLVRHGAAASFLHYYTTFAPGHALTGAIPHARGTDFFVFMFLPLLLLLLAFWYCVAAVRMRWTLDVRDWVMVAAAIVTFLYYQKFLARADWHVLQAVSPALPLLYYAIHKLLPLCGLRSRRARAAGGGLVLAATVLLASGAPAANLSRIPSNFIRVVPDRPVFDGLGWSEPAMAGEAAGWNEVRRFLDTMLGPGDTLFDFSNQPGLYHYLLRRKPATRYYHVSMAIRRSVQLDLVEELEQRRPKLVVFDTERGGLPEWDGVVNQVRHYEVSSYLLRRYRPFARLAGQVFYARNDLGLEPPAAVGSVELLKAPEAYARARACRWGYAPGFMRPDWLDPGPAAEQGQAVLARRLSLSGWASDARRLQPAREVLVLAGDTLVARAVPALKRPDVAYALHAPELDRSGFSIFREWIDPRRFEWSDLRVYATSLDGKASPLNTHWAPSTGGPSDLQLDGRTSIPVTPGAAGGWVDAAEEEEERITPFELPVGMAPSAASGIEFDAEVSRSSTVIVSDQPFVSTDPSEAARRPPPSGIFFRLAAPASGMFRVMSDNCPQWYGLRGRTLYVRYGDGVVVKGLRVLVRAAAQTPAPPRNRAASSARAPP